MPPSPQVRRHLPALIKVKARASFWHNGGVARLHFGHYVTRFIRVLGQNTSEPPAKNWDAG